MTDRLDPGADIGSEPKLEEETIPGGVQPGDIARDSSDVVDGPIGGASLNDPATNPDQGADLSALPGVIEDDDPGA